ncbi:type II toxin-antitoxin system RelE/ParE family toxin [Candidatus Pantoea multigeneris]|uniref:Diaminopimelate decarboxylase n=1 Tax=Candidatus Pantoea multigeneris TaxID=2608357 RepID=A0ABX0RGV1_9GAMM|nr:diaminopimelate decarboxylase [Pantoea multigeneris]
MWTIEVTDNFSNWFDQQDNEIQLDVIAALTLLEQDGPNLSRPHVYTLYGSALTNLKELRVQSKGRPVRCFFVFDPRRCAIVLCAGNKTGKQEKIFYRRMIKTAEQGYFRHLQSLSRGKK